MNAGVGRRCKRADELAITAPLLDAFVRSAFSEVEGLAGVGHARAHLSRVAAVREEVAM
jgi:hypothetical protein